MPESITFRTLLTFIVSVTGLLCILVYVLFQARFLIMGPQITLDQEPALLNNERQISLSGTAYNIARIWLNDRQIFTDAEGNFTEALILENGYTVATLRAEDRYGREATVTRHLVYTPASFVIHTN